MDKLDTDKKVKEIEEQINFIDKEIIRLQNTKSNLLEEKANLLQEKEVDKISIISSKQFNTKKFSWSSKIENILVNKFKLKSFLSYQLETINATLSERDCILIKPTGGGKSLCYQLPAVLGGVTIVVSPLVSLMQDQIRISESFGITCIGLDASCPVKVQNEVFKAMQSDSRENPTYQIIYVTPEKVAKSKKFMKALEKGYENNLICRFVIDEVHCCSQWGHDFRQDYKSLHIFKHLFTKVPLLGLTATASNKVVEDMKTILGLKGVDCIVFRDHYNRKNLFYDVLYMTPDDSESQIICRLIRKKYSDQPGIVYCFTQKDCEKLSSDLVSHGIKASFYHANLEYENRKSIHEKWLNEEYKVIVATIAFGMGIDKPNVRFVIHACMSKSLDNYYQESGRAGRDGKSADCLLLWRLNDFLKLGTNVFADQTGTENLNAMCRFGMDNLKCKRSFFAPIFQNQYKKEDCQNMCSVCQRDKTVAKLDISEILQTCISIINEVKLTKNPKITGNKLSNDVFEKLKKYRCDIVKNYQINVRLLFDRALAFLVLEGYLGQEFSFGTFKNFDYMSIGWRTLKENELLLETAIMGPVTPTPSDTIGFNSGKTDNSYNDITKMFSSNKRKLENTGDSNSSNDDFDFGNKLSKV